MKKISFICHLLLAGLFTFSAHAQLDATLPLEKLAGQYYDQKAAVRPESFLVDGGIKVFHHSQKEMGESFEAQTNCKFTHIARDIQAQFIRKHLTHQDIRESFIEVAKEKLTKENLLNSFANMDRENPEHQELAKEITLAYIAASYRAIIIKWPEISVEVEEYMDKNQDSIMPDCLKNLKTEDLL